MPIEQARAVLLSAYIANPNSPDDMKAALARLIVPKRKRVLHLF